MRADVMFAFPLLPLLAPVAAGAGRGRRAFLIGAAIAVAAAALFFLAQRVAIAQMPPRIVPVVGARSAARCARSTSSSVADSEERSLAKGRRCDCHDRSRSR
jgi:hypothetical protein